MSVIDDERLTLARIAELWSRECGVPEDTMRRGLAIIAHDGGFEFLIPSELVEYSEDAFFDPDLRRWHQSGLIDGIGTRIPSMQLRRDYVMGLARLLGGSRPKRNAQRRRPTDLSALDTTIVHPNGLGFNIAFLDREICALGLTSGELLSRYHSTCNEEPHIIREFQEKFYNDLAKRISVNRDAFLHWVRLQRPSPSPGEAVELPDPSFWRDIGSDRPVDWLHGIPGHEDKRAGLPLGEALKRYSDPHEWAKYEYLMSHCKELEQSWSMRATTNQVPGSDELAHGMYYAEAVKRQYAALVIKFEGWLRSGQLLVRGYERPNAASDLMAEFVSILPDKIPLAQLDYEQSRVWIGNLELIGVKIFPVQVVPLIGNGEPRKQRDEIQQDLHSQRDSPSTVEDSELPHPAAKRVSEAKFSEWYKGYVNECREAGKSPSRDEDWQEARRAIGDHVPRSAVREARRKFAPEEWRKRGRRKTDRN